MGRTREEGKGREREKGAFWLSFSYEATTDCKHTHTHIHTQHYVSGDQAGQEQ